MSDDTTTIEVLSLNAAMKLVNAALAHAEQKNWQIAVVVMDPNGCVLASARMDGVSPAIMDIASDKGFTAALGKTSKAFYERMSSSDDLRLGLQNRPRFCAWEGGCPLSSMVRPLAQLGCRGQQVPKMLSAVRSRYNL